MKRRGNGTGRKFGSKVDIRPPVPKITSFREVPFRKDAGMKERQEAAIYARVSTLNGQDPMMQTRELKEYCKRRGWTVVAEWGFRRK